MERSQDCHAKVCASLTGLAEHESWRTEAEGAQPQPCDSVEGRGEFDI